MGLGFSLLFGLPWTTITPVVIFLALGLGVDNEVLLTILFYRADKSKSVEKRAIHASGDAALFNTMSTVTTIFAFLSGGAAWLSCSGRQQFVQGDQDLLPVFCDRDDLRVLHHHDALPRPTHTQYEIVGGAFEASGEASGEASSASAPSPQGQGGAGQRAGHAVLSRCGVQGLHDYHVARDSAACVRGVYRVLGLRMHADHAGNLSGGRSAGRQLCKLIPGCGQAGIPREDRRAERRVLRYGAFSHYPPSRKRMNGVRA